MLQVVAALRPCLKAAESMVIRSWQQSIEAMEKRLLSALKQAAREIVDHLEKEAGARVVMAECKAAMVEQEHIQTKQQAHAMMLRLKDTSDTMVHIF
jgi:tRNA(Arg) A34 adenosine deaminase TadA